MFVKKTEDPHLKNSFPPRIVRLHILRISKNGDGASAAEMEQIDH
jgi:hypothetical protein